MERPIADRRASTDQESDWFFGHLFNGIELDDLTAARAREIIRATVEGLRIDRAPPHRQWDRWDEAMFAYQARDRQLLALLQGDARQRFSKNAAAIRAQFDELRARATMHR